MLRAQILLVGVLVAFVLYLVRLRTARRDRLLYLAMAGVGMVLVARPQLTQDVARLVGITRGADLVFYLFMLCALFVIASGAARLRTMERALTHTARAVALLTAEAPDRTPPPPPRSGA